MEPEKTPNSQSNPEKVKQSWRHHNSGLQTVLQSCNHQESRVLAQKQTHRSVEQNREPRNGPTNVYQLTFDKEGKSIQWKRQSSQQMVLQNWTVTCRKMNLD